MLPGPGPENFLEALPKTSVAFSVRAGARRNWQFAESVDYLRDIGALDESTPSMPSVLIANYVGSQSLGTACACLPVRLFIL